MAERIVASWYFTGQAQSYPTVNFNAFNRTDEATNEHVSVEDDHYKYGIISSPVDRGLTNFQQDCARNWSSFDGAPQER